MSEKSLDSGNIEYIEEEILSEETNSESHSTLAEILKQLDVSETSVQRIVKNDQKLKKLFKQMERHVLSLLDKQKSMVRARKLLKQVTQ